MYNFQHVKCPIQISQVGKLIGEYSECGTWCWWACRLRRVRCNTRLTWWAGWNTRPIRWRQRSVTWRTGQWIMRHLCWLFSLGAMRYIRSLHFFLGNSLKVAEAGAFMGLITFLISTNSFTRRHVFKFHWSNNELFLLNSALVLEVYWLQCSLFYRLFQM